MNSKHLVDPELLPVLDVLRTVGVSADTLQQWRGFAASAPAQLGDAGITVEERWILRTGGEVRVLRFSPVADASELRPGVIHLHAGGFVIGRPEMGGALCSAMAAKLRRVVISVDYRLAPEFPYPARPA
jgi:acetyl esterase/lipase